MAWADFVFEGTVVGSELEPGGLQVLYTFDDLLVLKGEKRNSVDVVTSAIQSACGTSFSTNTKYRIYATLSNNQLHTGLCSSSRALPFKWSELQDEAVNRSEYLLKNSPFVLIETQKLQQAGCQLNLQSSSVNACFAGDKKNAYYCDGSFLSSFSAQDGSYDQHDINFRWHVNINEEALEYTERFLDAVADDIEITHFSAPIDTEECINGMDSSLRWKRARTLSADSNLTK